MKKSLENAIRYISQEVNARPDVNKAKIVEEACQIYNLDPIQTEFLINRFALDKS